MMKKPSIFLSHVHEDKKIAIALEKIIKEALLGALDVFNSSAKSISIGDPWRDVIIDRLQKSITLLIVATPESVTSPWVNFESGGAWVAGNRVIPCCAKGMTPSSLPAPLSHLQAIDLSLPEGVKRLIEHLASLANLDVPSNFDYKRAVMSLVESWQTVSPEISNKEFLDWIKKVSVRPEKFKGETSQRITNVSNISAVTPFESDQFRGEDITPGESIQCWLKPIEDPHTTLYYCFAKEIVADLLSKQDKDVELTVKLKCLGQMKVYTTDIAWGEEDRGIEYPTAFLIEDARVME